MNDSQLQLAYIGSTLVATAQEVVKHAPDPEWFSATVDGVPLSEIVRTVLIMAYGGDPVNPIGLIRAVRASGHPWAQRVTTDFLQKAVEAHDAAGGIISEYTVLLQERWMAERISELARTVEKSAANGEDYRRYILDMHAIITSDEDRSALRGDIALERFVESWRGQKHIRIHTGIQGLDGGFLFISEGDMAIVGARTSHGKTVLATQTAIETARHGVPVVYYSSEMTREQIAVRMAAQITGASLSELTRGKINRYSVEIEQAKEALRELPLALIQTNRIDEVLVDMSRRFASGRSRVAIVDFIQDFRGRGSTDYEIISNFLKDLKNAAQRFNGIVLGTAQVNRGTEAGGKSRPPRKSDLKGSGTFEETADQIVLLWRRPDEDGTLSNYGEIIVDKQRNGAVGSVSVTFDPRSLYFSTL